MDISPDTGYFVTRTSRAFVCVTEARLRPQRIGVAHLPALVCLAEEGALTQAEIAANRVTLVLWSNLTVSPDSQPTANALLLKVMNQVDTLSS